MAGKNLFLYNKGAFKKETKQKGGNDMALLEVKNVKKI